MRQIIGDRRLRSTSLRRGNSLGFDWGSLGRRLGLGENMNQCRGAEDGHQKSDLFMESGKHEGEGSGASDILLYLIKEVKRVIHRLWTAQSRPEQ